MDAPVLEGWLSWLMDPSTNSARAAADRLGDPILGLGGPQAAAGVLSGWRAPPFPAMLSLRYGSNDRNVEVSNSTIGLGGTDQLVNDVLTRASRQVQLPFTLTVAERLIMLPVLGVRTQFRVISVPDGPWVAAGGYKKRHLRLTGTAGTSPDKLELVRVVLP